MNIPIILIIVVPAIYLVWKLWPRVKRKILCKEDSVSVGYSGKWEAKK